METNSSSALITSLSMPHVRRLQLFLERKQVIFPTGLPRHILMHYATTKIQSPKNRELVLMFHLASGSKVHINCSQYFKLNSFNFLSILFSGSGGQLLVYLSLALDEGFVPRKRKYNFSSPVCLIIIFPFLFLTHLLC